MDMPRSILKKSSVPSVDSPSNQQGRTRDTALYHANLIRHRKDVENEILCTMEELLDLPSSSDADPASPLIEEIAIVGKSLRLFQPSDYDALVEERNINKSCGYVLCPRPNRQQETNAKYRLIKAQGIRQLEPQIVRTRTLEKWCSDDCGRRALYLKAQLNPEPAWTRDASAGDDIVVFEDKNRPRNAQTPESTVLANMTNLQIGGDEEQVVAKMKALVIERGDAKMPTKSHGLVRIAEKDPSSLELLDFQSSAQDISDAIEGYRPRFQERRPAENPSEVDLPDLMSTI